MLKPMMGPLSGFGSEWLGIAVWTTPLGGGEGGRGIRVWMEAGRGCSDDWWVVVDVEVFVGFDEEDNDDETCWRFTKRRRWSWGAAA